MFKHKKEKAMKKIYMIPTTQIVNIKTNKMIAASLNISSYNADTNGGMLSRDGGDFWDDEDDDYDY